VDEHLAALRRGYDVFGTQDGAQGGINKYSIAYSTTTYPQTVNPMVQSQSETRTWTDRTGTAVRPGRRCAVAHDQPTVRESVAESGSGHPAPYNLEYSAAIQQEIRAASR